MQALNLPTYSFNIKSLPTGDLILDPCRKKWVTLTPEEWVRQHLVQYLVQDRAYPEGLISTELSLRINGLTRRTDVVVFDRRGYAIMLIECKAPKINLTQKVFDQVARYNWNMKVPYLVISNGLKHFCAQINQTEGSYNFLDEIPVYEQLEDQVSWSS